MRRETTKARWTWRKVRGPGGWRVILFWRGAPIGVGEHGSGYEVHWWSFIHHIEWWYRRRRGWVSVEVARVDRLRPGEGISIPVVIE